MPNPECIPNRISESDPTTESHERTNERTKISGSTLRTSYEGRRASNEGDIASIGEVIERGLWPGDRHPVVRIGDRTPIAPHVRSAVWYRDKGRCELCDTRTIEGAWHLDHIIPWSAGGSDATTNLRVLCEMHNMRRSNHVDPAERPRRAATWWCYRCYGQDAETWRYDADGFPICPVHTHSIKACPVTRGYLRQLQVNHDMPDWHRREPVTDPGVVAFCAHCRIPSLTDQPL